MARITITGRRAALATGAAVLALALAGGGWLWASRDSGGYHEHVTAAAGPYPAAFGTAPPDDPGRVLRPTTGTYALLGGLSLDRLPDAAGRTHGKDGTGGLLAHDLRTGKVVWRYERSGAAVGRVAAGRSGSGGTVAVWWTDGLLVALDARTGTPRWHQPHVHPKAVADPADPDPEGLRDLDVLDGLVLTGDDDAFTGYDATTGKPRWTAKPPGPCYFNSGVQDPMGPHLVTVDLRCNDKADTTLGGYDLRTGARRWTIGTGDWHPLNDHALVDAPTRWDSGRVADVSGDTVDIAEWPSATKRPAGQKKPANGAPQECGPDTGIEAGVGAGVLLCVERTTRGEGEGTLHAVGAKDGTHRWTAAPAKGTRFGSPLVAGNLVYVVQQPLTPPVSAADGSPATAGGRLDLLVLDLATGRRLHSTEVPPMPLDPAKDAAGPDTTLQPVTAADGLVGLAWADRAPERGADTLSMTVVAR